MMLLYTQNNSQMTSVDGTQESQHKGSAHQDSQLDDISSLINKVQGSGVQTNSLIVEASQDLLGMEKRQVQLFK
jgi:hypothetical protein